MQPSDRMIEELQVENASLTAQVTELTARNQRLKQAMHHATLLLENKSEYDWAWSVREALVNSLEMDKQTMLDEEEKIAELTRQVNLLLEERGDLLKLLNKLVMMIKMDAVYYDSLTPATRNTVGEVAELVQGR